MELKKHKDQRLPERKGQKRKLEEEIEEEQREISAVEEAAAAPYGEARKVILNEVYAQVNILNSNFSWNEAHRATAKRATHVLAELAKNEEVVNLIVEGGAVPALVKHLQVPPSSEIDHDNSKPFEHEVEKGSAFALGLLAVKVCSYYVNIARRMLQLAYGAYNVLKTKPEHQQLIVDAGALSHLVSLLKRQRDVHKDGSDSRAVNSVIRRAADAITNLAHENSSIKTRVRMEGGIPPLVDLLEFTDTKVQRAAAGALRTLAFKNDENKNQIVECNALPALILMLRSDAAAIHYEAVGVIGNLVHSSPSIKRRVLAAGALQPVIGLLSSCCSESQREAALLLGQFAATDSDCKFSHLSLALELIDKCTKDCLNLLRLNCLTFSDFPVISLSVFSASSPFCFGKMKNKLFAGAHCTKGCCSTFDRDAPVSRCSTERNVSICIGEVGTEFGLDGSFGVEEVTQFQDPHNQAGIAHNGGLVPLLKLLDSKNGSLQHNAAFSLYGLADNEDNVSDFISVGGVQKLQDGEFIVQLEDFHVGTKIPKQQLDGAIALYRLANKAMALSPVDAAPPSPTPQVYLGEQYVNNATLSDVTFLVEGCKLYVLDTDVVDDSMPTEFACLLPQMHFGQCLMVVTGPLIVDAKLNGIYSNEKDARDIEIPNIRWEVFELMMRFIYTGSVDVTLGISQDLLRAADQYLLEGLKRLCEYTIAQDITLENIASMYELSEAFHAISLRHRCILFILEQFDKLSDKPRHCQLIHRIIPEIRDYFDKALTKPNHH
ncbi:hypothetical protein DKX38_015336 [Salix brachista]|uniref:BTB domain-containing protein n=1 Tax=Salix brachista TaxID=2182728 RepID=A0A5N5L4X7_9ROSI|nr:hypothetical protein DKX38_015336 [Salix brachista]